MNNISQSHSSSGKKKGQKSGIVKKKNLKKKMAKSRAHKSGASGMDDLLSKLISALDKYKEVCYRVY